MQQQNFHCNRNFVYSLRWVQHLSSTYVPCLTRSFKSRPPVRPYFVTTPSIMYIGSDGIRLKADFRGEMSTALAGANPPE
jgi:hypothetical protein